MRKNADSVIVVVRNVTPYEPDRSLRFWFENLDLSLKLTGSLLYRPDSWKKKTEGKRKTENVNTDALYFRCNKQTSITCVIRINNHKWRDQQSHPNYILISSATVLEENLASKWLVCRAKYVQQLILANVNRDSCASLLWFSSCKPEPEFD